MPSARAGRALVLPAFVTLASLLAPGATLADCAVPPPVEQAIEQARVVLLGTVTATANRGTWAEVLVAEIWKGPDQPGTVTIRGAASVDGISSVDRTYVVGTKYLFFPFVAEGGGQLGAQGGGALMDNICTATSEWSPEMEGLRPDVLRTPTGTVGEASRFDLGGVLAPLGVSVLVAAALLGMGLLARGRQSE